MLAHQKIFLYKRNNGIYYIGIEVDGRSIENHIRLSSDGILPHGSVWSGRVV